MQLFSVDRCHLTSSPTLVASNPPSTMSERDIDSSPLDSRVHPNSWNIICCVRPATIATSAVVFVFATPTSQRRTVCSPRHWVDSIVLNASESADLSDLEFLSIEEQRQQQCKNRVRMETRLRSLWIHTHHLPNCPLLFLLRAQLRNWEVWRVNVASQSVAAIAIGVARDVLRDNLYNTRGQECTFRHAGWDATVGVAAEYASATATRRASSTTRQAVNDAVAKASLPLEVATLTHISQQHELDANCIQRLVQFLSTPWPLAFTKIYPAEQNLRTWFPRSNNRTV